MVGITKEESVLNSIDFYNLGYSHVSDNSRHFYTKTFDVGESQEYELMLSYMDNLNNIRLYYNIYEVSGNTRTKSFTNYLIHDMKIFEKSDLEFILRSVMAANYKLKHHI